MLYEYASRILRLNVDLYMFGLLSSSIIIFFSSSSNSSIVLLLCFLGSQCFYGKYCINLTTGLWGLGKTRPNNITIFHILFLDRFYIVKVGVVYKNRQVPCRAPLNCVVLKVVVGQINCRKFVDCWLFSSKL